MKYFPEGWCLDTYICNGVSFNFIYLSKYCKGKILEICAVHIVTTDKWMIVICVYRSPSSNFNHFLRSSDTALLSLNNQSMEILVCVDFNVAYLSNCNHKQKLSSLLGAYNMMHTVDFPTRFQNGHSSAIDSSFVDKARVQSYKIFPLSNALSNHVAQYIILNKFFLKPNLRMLNLKINVKLD
jgi:hypothetical protein